VTEHRPEADSGPLSIISDVPRNAEMELTVLRETQTPVEAFYVRSNFPAPEIDPVAWRLEIGGRVSEPFTLSLAELQAMEERVTRAVTLECAGNGRTYLRPQVKGTRWTLGATGTATFTGVPLPVLLDRAGVAQGAVEILFTGRDRGSIDNHADIHFQRSLPLADALNREHPPLVAWAMNGEPLALHHGAPVRLVVPGWYAVASVKWLARIEVLDAPFRGCFQTERYVYEPADADPSPVRKMRVRALVLSPTPPATDERGDAVAPTRVATGPTTISGIAWSGHGEVTRVQVSTDGGESWEDARLTPAETPFTPARWSLRWDATPGRHEVVARATDSSGAVQPMEQWWNARGYGNNVVHRVAVEVG
jgi:DMSO/TMAO reductase YedYZ molybdopterin-dependent catalytic subunit